MAVDVEGLQRKLEELHRLSEEGFSDVEVSESLHSSSSNIRITLWWRGEVNGFDLMNWKPRGWRPLIQTLGFSILIGLILTRA